MNTLENTAKNRKHRLTTLSAIKEIIRSHQGAEVTNKDCKGSKRCNCDGPRCENIEN